MLTTFWKKTGVSPGRTRHVLRAGVATVALAAAVPAVAQTSQTAQSSQQSGLKDVVVTATRHTTKLQKTPVAITVIGPQQIREQNLVTARDLAGKTPGVTIPRSGITPLTQIFYIRGIGDSDPIFDPSIAQYVDDVYLPRAINGMTDLTDLERVEIIRGPQGTLFGENADAGAIRYITREPTDTTTANFDVGGGTYDAFNLHAYAAGAVVPGKLDASLAYAHDQHNGYSYDPTINMRVNDQNTNSARLKLLAHINPDLTAELTVDGEIDHSDTAYYSPVRPIIGGTLATPVYGPTNLRDSYASQEPLNDSWVGGVSSKVVYIIDPHLTFKSISAYRGFAQNPVNYNNDGQPLVPYNVGNPQLVTISDNPIVYREQELSQEFQLLGNYDKFDFASGLFLMHENFASNRVGYTVSPTGSGSAPAYPEDQIGDTKTTDYAAYAQGDYHLTDKLIATLGGRYTIENRGFRFQGIFDNYSTTDIIPDPALPAGSKGAANDFTYSGDKTWYSFTPKYGLSYQFTPDIFGYTSIAEGFGAGGFNNRASTLAAALPYDQEKVTTYEIGLKTDWLNHRLRLNGTAFYNDYSGLQQTVAVISPVTNGLVNVRGNVNAAHTDGFELESVAQPIDGLQLNGNVSYLWSRFDSFSDPGVNVNTGKQGNATGNELPFAPRWQLYGAATYIVPVDLHGQVKIGADISYETSYYSDVFNYQQGKIHPQAYTDAFISYAPRNSRWEAILTGQNLADRRAYQSLTWSGSPNLWLGPVSPPRTVFFKLAYSY